MEYRQVGKTGLRASVIGLGMEELDFRPYAELEAVVHAAMDHGVNIIDMFMPGDELRQNIGKAIKGRRDKMMIQGHIGSTDINEKYDTSRDLATCKEYFERMLKCLGTDYIDFGMLFFVDTEEDYNAIFENGIVDYAQQLKKEGKNRAIGAGSHNPVTARKLVEAGILDSLMFSINPAFDMMANDNKVIEMIGKDYYTKMGGTSNLRTELYRLCEQKGVGITVMKTLGAGKLVSAEHTAFAEPLTVGQCIHYALSRPAVASALIGCRTPEEVMGCLEYLEQSEEERDYSRVIGTLKDDFEGSCVYCNHCQPCPVDINIGEVGKYLDIALLDTDNVPPSIQAHYNSHKAHASDCIECGSCEERCPFSVGVIERMHKAIEVFGH